ncbi:tetratricopeptide repeat-containing sensor histidine kinase [Psychroserpens sp. BH13MA-6]
MRNWGHFIGCALLLVSYFSSAQISSISEIDSILKKAHGFFKTDQDSALYYANIAYNKSLELNDTSVIAKAIIHKNTYLITQKKYEEAEALFNYNFKHIDALSETLKGETYYNFGSVKYLKEEYDLALENYFNAILHYKNAEAEKGLQRSYLQIGVIYSKRNRNDLADYFYEKSMASGVDSHHIGANDKLPTAHHDSEKLAMSKKMLSGIDDKDHSRLAAIIYYNMAQSYLDLKDYENVIAYHLKSIAVKDRIHYKSHQDKSYAFIGEAHFKLGNYSEAIVYLNKALEVSSKRQFKLNVSNLLYKAYEHVGDYKNALRVSVLHNSLKDALNLKEENERIAKITAEFETEKQAQEIKILAADNDLKAAQLSNQKTVLIAAGVGVVLLLIALFFAYKTYRTKQNLQFSELTQKLLQMQLNPHFLFNALNGIQYFIKKNDVTKSTKYIRSFSGLMRHILENSVEKFISIQEDYETIKEFLELQQLVTNHTFDYNIHIDESIDKSRTCIPPMFTQPFVENAIIHGVSNVKEGQITINYLLEDTHVVVEIIDNGKGISTPKNQANSLHKSMGTSITKQRMNNLLKMERYSIDLEIISENNNNESQGTKVVLSFPIKYL